MKTLSAQVASELLSAAEFAALIDNSVIRSGFLQSFQEATGMTKDDVAAFRNSQDGGRDLLRAYNIPERSFQIAVGIATKIASENAPSRSTDVTMTDDGTGNSQLMGNNMMALDFTPMFPISGPAEGSSTQAFQNRIYSASGVSPGSFVADPSGLGFEQGMAATPGNSAGSSTAFTMPGSHTFQPQPFEQSMMSLGFASDIGSGLTQSSTDAPTQGFSLPALTNPLYDGDWRQSFIAPPGGVLFGQQTTVEGREHARDPVEGLRRQFDELRKWENAMAREFNHPPHNQSEPAETYTPLFEDFQRTGATPPPPVSSLFQSGILNASSPDFTEGSSASTGSQFLRLFSSPTPNPSLNQSPDPNSREQTPTLAAAAAASLRSQTPPPHDYSHNRAIGR
jgi:hypothetical protein